MKKNLLKVLFAILSIVIITSCKRDADMTKEKLTRAEEISQAKEWYNSQLTLRAVAKKATSLKKSTKKDERVLLLNMEPNWKLSFRRQNKEYKTVEAVMNGEQQINFVPKENRVKSEQTGDNRYKQSMTRLVIRTDRKTNKKIGFIMSIVPSVEYIEKTNFNPFHITYLNRDPNFSGYIVFHDLTGNFVNGWKYDKGSVTARIEGSNSKYLTNDPDGLSKLKAGDCWALIETEIHIVVCHMVEVAPNEWTSTNCEHIDYFETRWVSVTCPVDNTPPTEPGEIVEGPIPHGDPPASVGASYNPSSPISRYYSVNSTLTQTQFGYLRWAYDQSRDDMDMNVLPYCEYLEACLDCSEKVIFKIDPSINSYIVLDKATRTVTFKSEGVIKSYYPFMGQIVEFIYELTQGI